MKKQLLFIVTVICTIAASFATEVPRIVVQNRQRTYTAQTSGEKNHQITITDANNRQLQCDLGYNTARIKHLAFNERGLQLQAITKGGKVITVDPKTGKKISETFSTIKSFLAKVDR